MASDFQFKATEAKQKAEEVKERKRANRAQEGLTKRGQDTKLIGDLFKGTGSNLAAIAAGSNDVKWYLRFMELARIAGRVNTGIPGGFPVENDWFDSRNPNDDVYIPSSGYVARINYIPTLGRTNKFSVVKNVAQRIYTYIRHWNSGATNYDETEYLFYLYSVVSLYELHAYLSRIYGVMNSFSVKNVNTPRVIITSMGLNYDDIKENLPQLEYLINNLGAQISSFAVPNDMTLVHRRYWLNLNIFKDRNSERAQYFYYCPDFLYKYGYDVDGDVITSKLEPVALPGGHYLSGNRSFQDLKNITDQIVNALYTYTDIGVMSGDTAKAFKNARLMQVPSLPTDFKVVPHWDENASIQFHNTRLLTLANTNIDDHIITQDPVQGLDNALSKIYFVTKAMISDENEPTKENFTVLNRKLVMDVPYEEISPEQFMEYSRNFPILESEVDDHEFSTASETGIGGLPRTPWTYSKIYTCGTEIMTTMVITTRALRNKDNQMANPNGITYPAITELGFALDSVFNNAVHTLAFRSLFAKITLLSMFETHPKIYLYQRADGEGPNSGEYDGLISIWDTDNVFEVTPEQLDNMNYAALMSELMVTIPGFEK